MVPPPYVDLQPGDLVVSRGGGPVNMSPTINEELPERWNWSTDGRIWGHGIPFVGIVVSFMPNLRWRSMHDDLRVSPSYVLTPTTVGWAGETLQLDRRVEQP